MQQEIFTSIVYGRRIRRINKTAARKAYNNGKMIFMQSCNIPFDSAWKPPFRYPRMLQRASILLVNMFQYYNCDSERGRYPHYYIEDK